MGNQRASGSRRPFPEERAQASDAHAMACAWGRAQLRERVDRHRQRRRLEESIPVEWNVDEGEATLTRRSLHSKANRVIEVLEAELISCPGSASRAKLFHILWSHPSVTQNLPEFYLPPKEAKAQMEVIANLQRELDAVKGVQSTNKLVVRGALLSAAVSTEVSNLRAIAKVLKTSPSNVENARHRRHHLQSSGSSVWAAPRRRQRSDVLTEEVVTAVGCWWAAETRVSPNKKDVVRKRIPGGRTAEEHATHFLLESQVRPLSSQLGKLIVIFSIFCCFLPSVPYVRGVLPSVGHAQKYAR